MKKITTKRLLSITSFIWIIVFIFNWIEYGTDSQETNILFIIALLIGFTYILYDKLDDIEKKL